MDCGPEHGVPEAEIQCPVQVLRRSRYRDTHDAGELHGAELRDQRTPVTPDGDKLLRQLRQDRHVLTRAIRYAVLDGQIHQRLEFRGLGGALRDEGGAEPFGGCESGGLHASNYSSDVGHFKAG